MDRQHDDQKKTDKGANIDLQSTTRKAKDCATRIHKKLLVNSDDFKKGNQFLFH